MRDLKFAKGLLLFWLSSYVLEPEPNYSGLMIASLYSRGHILGDLHQV